MILYHLDTEKTPHRIKELEWQKRGLQFSRTGYGRRIPTVHQYKVGNRWRRVYVCIFSNAGTAYIEAKERDPMTGRKAWIVVD